MAVLRAHQKQGEVLEQDFPKFEMLIRRCRTPEEYDQVMGALNHYLADLKTGTDRYAKLLRDDVLGSDDAITDEAPDNAS